jgi:hypothetical protein
MTWAAIAGGGAALGGSLISGLFGSNAADESASSQEDALALQQSMYNQGRADLAPWRARGKAGLNALWKLIKAGPGEYQKSPYYDWLQQQGTQALERGAAARGGQFSGAEQKALTQYGQNLASTDYDNWLNRWYKSLTPYQNMSSMGLQAAGASAGQSLQGANMMGNTMTGIGETNAARQLGYGATAQQGGNQLADMLYRLLGNQNATPQSAGVPNDYNQNFYNYYSRGGA